MPVGGNYTTKNFVNEIGNQYSPGVVARFSDLEVIALNLTAESIGIDTENYLFAKLSEYRSGVVLQINCNIRTKGQLLRQTF